MVVLFFFWSMTLHAEPTAFERALEQNQTVSTEERWVDIRGVRYREVRVQGKRYYLQFRGRDQEYAELDCELKNPSLPHLAEAGVEVFKRTTLFVQLLKETCEQRNGQRRIQLSLEPRLGVKLPDSPHSAIKNKSIYVTPLGPGFSGDW